MRTNPLTFTQYSLSPNSLPILFFFSLSLGAIFLNSHLNHIFCKHSLSHVLSLMEFSVIVPLFCSPLQMRVILLLASITMVSHSRWLMNSFYTIFMDTSPSRLQTLCRVYLCSVGHSPVKNIPQISSECSAEERNPYRIENIWWVKGDRIAIFGWAVQFFLRASAFSDDGISMLFYLCIIFFFLWHGNPLKNLKCLGLNTV